jgi:hypothetical protein
MRGHYQYHADILPLIIRSDHQDSHAFHIHRTRHILGYAISEHARSIMKFCLFWLVPQLLVGTWPQAIAKLDALSSTGHRPLILVSLVVFDLLVCSILCLTIMCCVMIHGPTNAAYVTCLNCCLETGDLYRGALRNMPRSTDDPASQAEKWEYARIFVKQLARLEAQRKMRAVITGLILVTLYFSCISMWLSTHTLDHPILALNGKPMGMDQTVLKHLYFFLVTFSTIGYGDVTFVSSLPGQITGIVCATLVMLTGIGFVAYINHFVVNMKERLIAGLDTNIPLSERSDWIGKSLREV